MGETIDLLALLERHGLRPRRRGSRVRFMCPSHQRESKRGDTPAASADLSEEHNPWRCWSCQATGTARSIAIMLGELTPEVWTPPVRVAAVARPPAAVTMDDAWQWLAERAGASPAAVEAWALRRGWPADVAAAAALTSDALHTTSLAAWPRAVDGPEGRAADVLRTVRGRAGTCRLLLPLRSPSGVVVSAARRWDLLGTAPPSKSMRLPGDVADDAPIAVYGDCRAAAGALDRGEPCYLVEGGPDHIALTALLASRGLPGVVVGAYSAQTYAATAEAIATLCRRIPQRLVLVPDSGAAGEAARDAALAALRGDAGVYLAHVGSDLAAHLETHGADATIAAVTMAQLAHRAPVAITESGGAVAAALDALHEEVAHDRTALGVLVIPPGVGKTHAALKLAARVATGEQWSPSRRRLPPGPERRVVFALASHALCEEKEAELAVIAPGTAVAHLRGLLAHCRYADHVAPYAASGRRGICGVGRQVDPLMRCTYADTCAGAQTPEAIEGAVTLAPHAMAHRLDADLCIIDESPGVVATEVIGALDVATIYDHHLTGAVRCWSANVIETSIPTTARLATVGRTMALAHAARVSSGDAPPHARRIWGAELVAALRAEGVTPAHIQAAYIDAPEPPPPLPMDVRDGLAAQQRRPSRVAWRALKILAESIVDRGGLASDALADVLGAPQAPPSPLPCLRLDATGSWALELRTVAPLPKAPTIVLDATGELTEAEWRAAYPGRRIVVRSVDVAGARARALHVDTGVLSRRVACPRGVPSSSVVARLEALVGLAAREVRAAHASTDPRVSVGLITHAPLVDVASAPPDVELSAGYYGRDDRGTNRWGAADAIVVAGDPVPELGAIEMDAALLRLDADAMCAGRVSATLTQAVARVRHTRRGPGTEAVIVYAGKRPPALHGIRWERRAMPGEDRVTQGRATLADLALHVAARRGCETSWADVCDAPREGELATLEPASVSHTAALKALQRAASQLGWLRDGMSIRPRR